MPQPKGERLATEKAEDMDRKSRPHSYPRVGVGAAYTSQLSAKCLQLGRSACRGRPADVLIQVALISLT